MTRGPISITYREDKATQAAARLLKLAGGKPNHMKLIALLYLADRLALITFGRPITFDWYLSMPHGPVLSLTLDKINNAAPPDGTSYWHRFISERRDHEVALLGDAPRDQLSPAEEQLLDAVWKEFGKMSQWELRDSSHSLPEWRDPKGSSVPIKVQDILLAEGLSEAEVREVVDTLNAEEFAARLAGA